MQRKYKKMRSWRGLVVIAGAALVPLSFAADRHLDSLWEDSRLYSTPAALTAEELATATASTHTGAAQNRVQVGRTDTLWSIARSNRPSRNITIKQAMLAIRDANPRAFPSGNINDMEAGVTLAIPSAAAMRSRTAQQAEEEVRRQNQAWVSSRPALQQPRTTQPEQPEATAPIETERDLQLTARQQEEVDEQQALIEELEVRLEQSEDALSVAEREKDELATRLSEMQEQLDTLQQLLRLKDEQLEELEAQVTAGSPSVAEPVVSAPASQELATLDDWLAELQRQPLILAALISILLLLILLLLALVSTRRKLAAQIREQAEIEEARRREEELHSLTDSNARPDDFNRDLNAQPLGELEDLDDYEDLELDEDLIDDLAELDEEMGETSSSKEPRDKKAKAERDPLQEAEMFIAYGRLEQAAGFLQNALATNPEREDLRVKLLEVLVELNDEDTFNQQHQQLKAQQPSAASVQRAEELAGLIKQASGAAAGAATAGAAASVAAKEEAQAEDLGELELPGDDLADLELDDIFGSEEAAPRDGPKDLDELDLGNLDELEAELDEVLTEKPPLEPEPEENLVDDLADLEEVADDELEDLDLELDLEKPLDETELGGDETDLQDFEPVDYKSDADDFMSALDDISEEGSGDFEEELAGDREIQRAPGVDEELSALSSDLSELIGEEKAAQKEEDWDDLGDLAELDDLELSDDELLEPQVSDMPLDDDFSSLDDLADLGDDLDFGNEEDLNTQLDLATAYIEMGDKQGAQEILEKVIAEGDADQQATAKQMLGSLAG